VELGRMMTANELPIWTPPMRPGSGSNNSTALLFDLDLRRMSVQIDEWSAGTNLPLQTMSIFRPRKSTRTRA
jgi:hypothetical protein